MDDLRSALAVDDRMISWPRFSVELVLTLLLALVIMDQMLWAGIEHHRHPSWHHHRHDVGQCVR